MTKFESYEHLNNPLSLAQNISSTLSFSQQLTLVNYWLFKFWQKYHNPQISEILSFTTLALQKRCQPQLIWDVTLLKLINIYQENLTCN